MSKSKKLAGHSQPLWLVLILAIGLFLIIGMLLRGHNLVLFNPRGIIADQQHRLMMVSILIMLVIAVPALFLFYFFAWRYREGSRYAVVNHHSRNSKVSALFFWSIPSLVVLALASNMLPATQKLEPQREIQSANAPMTVQVVALRWKWLFIYPEQGIATVNYVEMPVDTPVQFELTADEAPMNSFWIPQLGGQLYAMTGHQNRLNLMAKSAGQYQGSAAEISGAGFAGMRFITHATSRPDFDAWVQQVQQSPSILDNAAYRQLLLPSQNNQTAFYSDPEPLLYSSIIAKYAGSHHHHVEAL